MIAEVDSYNWSGRHMLGITGRAGHCAGCVGVWREQWGDDSGH